ncbi:MAG: glycoside hydrolase family 9 protein [Nostocaceae cyanobacterium]|nr:glycoside hydrolase family 9 protein [Nostocaceae cyanobacterium]
MNTADLLVTDSWNDGFVGYITIGNNGNSHLSEWTLEFYSPFEINNIWNAQIVSHQVSESGHYYIVQDVGWNSNVSSGSEVSFGFQASYSGELQDVSNYILNGEPLDSTAPVPVPLPTLSINEVTVNEGDTDGNVATFEVQLSEASDEEVTVNYTTKDGTAIAGSDYSATAGTITFAPRETSKTITVPIAGDTIEEEDKTFILELSESNNATIANSQGIGTIIDDDQAIISSPITVQFAAGYDWGNGFTGNLFITNNGNTPLNTWTLEFEADFQIYEIWGAEFESQPGGRYLIENGGSWNPDIAPGETISFGFNANYSGQISEPTNYFLNGQPLDSPITLPTVSISDIAVTEGDTGVATATFEVQLSEASDETVTVEYATADDTAMAGDDYTVTAGTITFAPSETSQTINVEITGDTSIENDETFTVNLSNPSNASIIDGQGVGTIFNDDASSPVLPELSIDSQGVATIINDDSNNNDVPQQGSFNYGEALQKSFLFYEAQRSGELPDDNRIEWRGDSALNDRADSDRPDVDVDVDLSGGYYDAGDGVKFGFPMAAAMTMLSWGVVEYRDAYEQSGQLDEALEAIKWGTDYILKAHITDENGTKEFWGQVGDGNADHAYWGPPEEMTMDRPAFKIDRENPGSDLAGEAAAALAAASIIFRSTDSAYADTLLQNAQQLYEFADTYRGKYSVSIPNAAGFYNSWSGYNDELAWGATWLYKATGDQSYLTKAQNYYQGVGQGETHSWDDKDPGIAVLLAQETDDGSQYRDDVENWLDSWSNPNSGSITYTNGGLAWASQWGSLRYSANTAFLAGVYSDRVTDYQGRYSNFANSQINYMLGDNPRNFSYMVGFGNDYPLRPHHRAAHGGDWSNFNDSTPNNNILYGALVGGPASADDYDYVDDRTDYIRNEVALDYNAGFTGALVRMYDQFGGNPLSEAELNSLPGITTSNS